MTCTKAVKQFTIQFDDKELSDIERALMDRQRSLREWLKDHPDDNAPKILAHAGRLENMALQINHIRLQQGL
jgi:hypothetical protein